MKKHFLFVGLDYYEPDEVADFAGELCGVNRDGFGFKLNLDFLINTVLSRNYRPFEKVMDMGKPVFVDLKMWNGKRTMNSIAEGLIKRDVDYFNVYSLADKPFLESLVKKTRDTKTKVLGVTVLTHYDENYCQRKRGCSFEEAVRSDAETAYNSGCDGIILPGTMLREVSDLQIEKLVPAVRPDWFGKTGDNYQKQEVSIKEAIDGGANLLVCSSPIRNSQDRKEALIKTLDEIDSFT